MKISKCWLRKGALVWPREKSSFYPHGTGGFLFSCLQRNNSAFNKPKHIQCRQSFVLFAYKSDVNIKPRTGTPSWHFLELLVVWRIYSWTMIFVYLNIPLAMSKSISIQNTKLMILRTDDALFLLGYLRERGPVERKVFQGENEKLQKCVLHHKAMLTLRSSWNWKSQTNNHFSTQ